MYACNPIIAQGKTIGTLSFGAKARKHFSEDEIAVMDAMADQIAIALERMKTTKALRESEAKYRALF